MIIQIYLLTINMAYLSLSLNEININSEQNFPMAIFFK